ncbi:predicted protein [Thalassiosira pseudonana CCMP1335]|uniref:RXYLT1 C-terminal domain-containing protein n=1 Tax=Thalassiosira pseudonana TaxID=35128 RepID=B5YNC8_THAPS|nr:predicted protein [Thalassiosira pseudonana CCMP1335]ACI64965.1 predicted protein [Thalassiosira pseudonana CCMP1335]
MLTLRKAILAIFTFVFAIAFLFVDWKEVEGDNQIEGVVLQLNITRNFPVDDERVDTNNTDEKVGQQQHYHQLNNINNTNEDDELFNEYELQRYMLQQRTSLINSFSILNLSPKSKPPAIFRLYSSTELQTPQSNEDYHNTFSNADGGDMILGSACMAIKAFRKNDGIKPHVLFVIDENWGAFSDIVPTRTDDELGGKVKWSVQWNESGCSLDDLWYYLNHTNASAIFTTQHQSAIEPHPKVFPFPLGVFRAKDALNNLMTNKQSAVRTTLLVINQSHWRHRIGIAEEVIAKFNGTISNTYMDGTDYWQHLQESKFILSPSGIGFDTYRTWDALTMGAIPVLETYYRNDGFYRIFDDLPVLWVDHYDNVTPALLEEEYPKIIAKARSYNFEKLTIGWWYELINCYRPSRKRAAGKE